MCRTSIDQCWNHVRDYIVSIYFVYRGWASFCLRKSTSREFFPLMHGRLEVLVLLKGAGANDKSAGLPLGEDQCPQIIF